MILGRRILTAVIILFSTIAFVQVYYDWLTIYVPPVDISEIHNSCLYILSSLMQSLSAILGITVAALFITAQISVRNEYARTLPEIYKNYTTLFVLSSFFIAILTNLITLNRLSLIIASRSYQWIDFNVIIASVAILLLGPLILSQIENFSLYIIAVKLSRNITIKRISSYNLVQVQTNSKYLEESTYKLTVWGNQHGRDDPLGSFHEIVMSSVQNRDRLLLSSLVRLLLKRIAKYSAVPFSVHPRPIGLKPNLYIRMRQYCYFVISPNPSNLQDRLTVTIHIFHYLIRRALYLKKEWGKIDSIRQQFILNIADLIESLNMRYCSEQSINICIIGVMHICLGFSDVQRSGQYEALARYFELSNQLYQKVKYEQASLCIRMIALISQHTNQIPIELASTLIKQLPKNLQQEFVSTQQTIKSNPDFKITGDIIDPWEKILKYDIGLTKGSI